MTQGHRDTDRKSKRKSGIHTDDANADAADAATAAADDDEEEMGMRVETYNVTMMSR